MPHDMCKPLDNLNAIWYRLCVFFMWSLLAAPLANAQNQNEVTPDKIKSSLLRAAGWSADWSGPGGSGLTEVIFEEKNGQITAKMHLIQPFDLSCEKDVTITSGVIKFDGCRDPEVTLTFDPNDLAYPFKGKSPRGYEWKLRAK